MTASAFDLLPPNATPYERALARAARRILEVPTPIREVFRPFETSASVLPYLAWERSVDFWPDDWSETAKRAITARSIHLHKRKGTAYALREYVRYAGGTVREITTPPQKVFSGPALTREQREAWLSKLPQVRTWRIQESGTAPAAKSFYGGKSWAHFVEGSFAIPSTAQQRLRRRARWVVDDVETETRVSDFGGYFRLHIKAAAGLKVFSNEPFEPGKFFIPSDARKRLVTIQPETRLPWRSPVGPTLTAVTSEPERVVVRGTKGAGVFSGDICRDGFWVPSTAPLRIFQRYAVFDGSRPNRSPAIQFMGVGRYGFPAHTAHVKASIPGKRSDLAAGDGIIAMKARFWIPSTASDRVRRVQDAIVASKRASDRILMSTGPERKFIAGRVFRAGQSFIVGRPN
jgi:phage tail P2-like protein